MNEATIKYLAELGSDADDAELRALLRNCPMRGDICLSFEREPSLFYGSEVEGENHLTFMVRQQPSRRIVAMGSSCDYEAWVDGQPVQVGYLSQLRVLPEFQKIPSITIRGYRLFQEVAESSPLPFYVTTIASDNVEARRFLATKKRGFPIYTEQGEMNSLVIPLTRLGGKRRPTCWNGIVRHAALEDVERICIFLNREMARFAFAPVWHPEWLLSPTHSRGLSPSDFLLAEERGEITGCVALWNQTSFKQTVVRGYVPWLRRLRPLVNLLTPVTGTIPLPQVGSPFSHAYLSHFAARDNAIALRLMTEGCLAARRAGYSYVTTGFGSRHPQAGAILDAFRHRNYRSIIYTVQRESDTRTLELAPDAIPHLEIARL